MALAASSRRWKLMKANPCRKQSSRLIRQLDHSVLLIIVILNVNVVNDHASQLLKKLRKAAAGK